jgi:replicative DNA helicase
MSQIETQGSEPQYVSQPQSSGGQDTSLGRVPPHDIQAEACVLGSMVLDASAVDLVVQINRPEHFYRPAHQVIFEALVELRQDNKPIDLVMLRDELIRRKQLDAVGGVDYLVALAEGVPNAANAEYYSHIVRSKAMLRQLIQAGTDIVREAYDSHQDAREIVDQAEKLVFEIAQQGITAEAVTLQGLLDETFAMLEASSGETITGLATGYHQLDEMTSGFQPGEMIILAARPSMGKTSLLMNIAEYMAVVDQKPLAFFSLEMGAQQIAQRLLSSHARFDLRRLRRGMISPEDWTRLQLSAGDLQHAPIYIDDSPELTILQLRAKCRRLQAAHGIKAVFIDYLQLMSYHGRADSRQQQITEISRGIKALARELQVPVITAAQLNRGPTDRESHRPRMSDLRESGSIEQDADVVSLLHSEDYYHRGEPDYIPTNVTELIIAKQRNGPTGLVKLVFMPEITRFESAAPDSYTM